MLKEIGYWVAFNLIPNLGTVGFRRLEAYFGSLEDAWSASSGQLKASGLDDRAVRSIIGHRDAISPAREAERLDKAGVRAITWHDAEYPPRLKEIYDPPPIVYLRGSILHEDWRAIAVVGTRKATAYGREVAAMLTHDLARAGITIVSGLARGIDGVAHQEALRAGGRTLAVLASGLDTIYPPEHGSLAASIRESGALLSEHPLGTKPRAQHFPRRNRLMSGMTLGTLVVEAGEASGALLTVKHALEQDREVFCVPGSIFSPASRGTNHLIQQGAKLVYRHEDILEELNLSAISHQMEMRSVLEPQDDQESLLLGHISYEPAHIDEIRLRVQLPIDVVSSTLAMMELKGLVHQVGGMHYVRTREAVAPYGS